MLQSTLQHNRGKRRLIAATVTLVRREWARMGDDLDASWASVSPRIVRLVTAAQLGSARASNDYIATALDEQKASIRPEAQVRVGAFAGVATDLEGLTYGSLDSLLYGAVVHARTAQAESLAQRLATGGQRLDMLVQTQVADAGRMAASTAITARPKTGWIRMVNPPCCQRCAVLAGKLFKSNQGFQRHPGCDCTHIPYAESDPYDPGIRIGAEDVKDLTQAQRRAIADGADMNQVINSHRVGARSKDLMRTTEGVTKRGVAGKRLIADGGSVRGTGRYSTARKARLTPKGIYEVAGDDRDEALRLLKAHGYIF